MSLSGYAMTDGRDLPPVLTESYPAVAGSVASARETLAQFAAAAGAEQEQIDAVRLAVSEAVTNAVLHAYRDRPGHVTIAAWAVNGELWVLIADDGSGLRAASDRSGLGLGLALIQQVSDQLTIVERAGGGTELRVRFAIAGEGDHHSADYRRGDRSRATWPA